MRCAGGALALGLGDATLMSCRTYEVRITGHRPTQELLDEFGEVEVAAQEMRTVLSCRLPDQAAVYRFLKRLRAYGLEVVEIRRVVTYVEEPAAHAGADR